MSVNLSVLASNDAGNAIVDRIDVGSIQPNGYIEIWSGIKPISPSVLPDPSTDILLSTCAFSNPAYGDFNNRIGLANPIEQDSNIAANGRASWFRVYNRDGEVIFDGDVGLTDSGADLEFDSIDFIKGGTVAITSLDAVMPE